MKRPLSLLAPLFSLLLLLCVACSSSGDGAGDATTDVGADALDGQANETPEEETPALPPFDWCEAETPPDAACFASKRDPGSENITLALAIARRFMARQEAAKLGWDWVESVMLVGIWELYKVTGAEDLHDYVRDYMDHHINKGYVIAVSDTVVPAGMAIPLWAELEGEAGAATYRAVIDDALHYLYEEALRTEHGGLSHWGTNPLFEPTLWVDSLFMFGNVLLRWVDTTGDEKAWAFYAEQFHIFIDVLQDPSGWFVHGWGWPAPQDPEVYWARGNGWVTASAAELLRLATRRGVHDEAVAAALTKQIEAIMATQDADTGMWWTVPNRPGETYLETSCGGLFAFGMARAWRYGHAGDEVLPHIKEAIRGLKSKIVADEDGPKVTGTSLGTGVGGFDNYAAIGVGDDVPFGIGAAILGLVETSGLPLP